jgi:LAGLIDADG endonuclease
MVLLTTISEYFGCGRVEKRRGNACDYTVTSQKSFERKIIPFFNKYPLRRDK